MKKLSIFLIITIFVGFGCKKQNKTEQTTQQTQEILTGKITRADFMQPPYNEWFQTEYTNYLPDTNVLKQINKDKLNASKIVIVMATWCPDSRREVPRFYKILDQLAFDQTKITLLAVPKPFKDYELIKNYNIERVPTFIFFDQNNNEIGRIIEKPKKTLEEDMAEILK